MFFYRFSNPFLRGSVAVGSVDPVETAVDGMVEESDRLLFAEALNEDAPKSYEGDLQTALSQSGRVRKTHVFAILSEKDTLAN